jgi:hypothetical protein
MIRWAYTTTPDGRRIIYEYKTSWGKRYYSFDSGESWHLTKSYARNKATAENKLHLVTNGLG